MSNDNLIQEIVYPESTTQEQIVEDLVKHQIFPNPKLLAAFEDKNRREQQVHINKLVRDGLLGEEDADYLKSLPLEEQKVQLHDFHRNGKVKQRTKHEEL